MGILAITKATVMTEILDTENAYYRGANFEILFGEFLKSDLGWDGDRERVQQKGKSNSKGSQVDIIGFKKDPRYRKLYNLGLLYLIIGWGLFLIALLFWYLDYSENIVLTCCLSGFIGIIGAGYCFWDCNHYKQENAWVECKNRKGKATYEQVQKCINEYNDYKDSGDKEFKYVSKYFVSASGFVENALKLALDNKFDCYEYKDGKFEKVTYWK